MKNDNIASKIHVVIIDDHEIVCNGLETMINSQEDLEVVGCAYTVKQGLEAVIEMKPDILISDISMPDGSPFRVAIEAKKRDKNLKTIFLTAYASDTNLDKALKAGADAIILKGQSIEDLTSAIRRTYKGERVFSQEILDRFVPDSYKDNETPKTRKSTLSQREIEVLCCVANGMTAKKTASDLFISAKTVERHKSNIMTKLNMHSQVELAKYAIREGFILA